ncbi:cation transporter [Cutibacterium avidum]|uniref:cation transporter n=1 Tax=Cutibacterium avidum TaxID=33010 RepID=UPI0009BC96F4|nr:cation transporter [Cutibacterium avidum]
MAQFDGSPTCISDTADEINSPSTRRIIALVTILNAIGLVIDVTVASIIGSASLFADAADFLEDVLINGLVLVALGWSVQSRRKASIWLAGLILIPAAAALGTAVWKITSGVPPEPVPLSVTAIIALLINLSCAIALMTLRGQRSSLVRGAWLAARNDVLGNVLILVAGLITTVWFTVWPDVVVGLVMAVINATAAKEVWEQARREVPELEVDAD